jgi:hypothetical protein
MFFPYFIPFFYRHAFLDYHTPMVGAIFQLISQPQSYNISLDNPKICKLSSNKYTPNVGLIGSFHPISIIYPRLFLPLPGTVRYP